MQFFSLRFSFFWHGFSVFQNGIHLSFSYFAVGRESGDCPLNLLDERIVRDHRNKEKQIMNEILEEYLSICRGKGVNLSNIIHSQICRNILKVISG